MADSATRRKPLVLMHFMDWFRTAGGEHNQHWHGGWGTYKKDFKLGGPLFADGGRGAVVNGGDDVDFRYSPLIGPYDSRDPDVILTQLLLMKMAGIDGLIFDFYGIDESNLMNSLCVLLMCEHFLEKLEMMPVFCLEDEHIVSRIAKPRAEAERANGNAVDWVDIASEHLAGQLSYIAQEYGRIQQKGSSSPPLFCFGPKTNGLLEFLNALLAKEGAAQPLTGQQRMTRLRQFFDDAGLNDVAFVTHAHITLHRLDPVQGLFEWKPTFVAGDGTLRRTLTENCKKRLAQRSAPTTWVPIVMPRFHDSYASRGSAGPDAPTRYGVYPDRNGQTLRDSLDIARSFNSDFVQIVTFNDWQEGTSVEPSRQHGLRDLEIIQAELLADNQRSHDFTVDDLRLPLMLLYALRRGYLNGKATLLDAVVETVSRTKRADALRQLLDFCPPDCTHFAAVVEAFSHEHFALGRNRLCRCQQRNGGDQRKCDAAMCQGRDFCVFGCRRCPDRHFFVVAWHWHGGFTNALHSAIDEARVVFNDVAAKSTGATRVVLDQDCAVVDGLEFSFDARWQKRVRHYAAVQVALAHNE